MILLNNLLPGDCLIFSRTGLFDDIIKAKTFSEATHIEIYIGNGHTVASRNGQGALVYTADLDGLYAVLRPILEFDLEKGMEVFTARYNGVPYGWTSLAEFARLNLPDDGVFCSELATIIYRESGLDPFNQFVSVKTVPPSYFLAINEKVMKYIWIKDE